MAWIESALSSSVCVLLYLTSAAGPVKANLPLTFGAAQIFHPLPDTVVGAHCAWEVKLNTVYNRIPPTITEILCSNPFSQCGGNSHYECRQIRAKMQVAYNDTPFNIDGIGTISHQRNITVAVGCSCVMKQSTQIEQYRQHLIEKKSYDDVSRPAYPLLLGP